MQVLKPFLVDVPVRVNVWIRPECQKAQFEVLKNARPSILFIQSDGGRNEKEWEAIRKNRELIDNGIDWECTVYKVYEDKNLGLYTMGRKIFKLIWSKVDRCIFLEDDQIPSVSYFKYCAELLEKYKDDTRINCICAMNSAGVWEDASSDYFFSERGSIWGRALWKRNYINRDYELDYSKDPYTMKLLKNRVSSNKDFLKRVEGYASNPLYDGHMPGGEFFSVLEVYGQNQLCIIPKYNMMCNIGCTAGAAHSSEYHLLPKSIRSIFNMKTYECDFPLKHPKYVMADMEYKNYEEKVLGRNRPIRIFFRKIEVFLLIIKYKGFKNIILKILKKFKNRKRIET